MPRMIQEFKMKDHLSKMTLLIVVYFFAIAIENYKMSKYIITLSMKLILDEPDTEDEEEEDEEGEETIGGEFNEEPGNDSGCTAVVALLRGRDLFVANAGDSRCVICRDGKVSCSGC